MPALELVDVGRVFPGPPEVVALSDVTLGIEPGEYVAITGPSGSGKSTLLNLLGLLDVPSTGEYRIDGVETTNLAEDDRTALRGRRIGFVFQDFQLLPHRSASENAALGLLYAEPKRTVRIAAARAALRRVGLGHRLDADPTTMSGGERQRVAIARALVGDPQVLLCDEPTGNLDSATAQQVLAVLEELNAGGLTLLVITHDEGIASRAGRRLVLADGRIVADRLRDIE